MISSADCPELVLENGVVLYSNETTIGSVASYICNEEFVLGDPGNSTRTCGIEGWSGGDNSCEHDIPY